MSTIKKFIFFLILLVSSTASAQHIWTGSLEGRQIRTKESEVLRTLEGTPYLSEDFQSGTINMEGKQSINALFRYDVYNEEIQIKFGKDSEEIYVLTNHPDNVLYIGGEKIVPDQINFEEGEVSGLFLEHYNGEKYRLLEKPNAEISEAVKAKTGFQQDKPAEIKISSDFYIIEKGQPAYEVRIKHRDIKKVFSSKEAKAYLSENKIREIQDLIKFLEHLERSN